MKTRTLKQLLLYNYRYWFGYSIIAIFAAYFLFWQLGHVRPGLSQLELETAARHLNLASILHMPLYPVHSLLQWASMKLLGINSFSLSLPSVVLSMFTAYFMYVLLKRWFGKSTALLSTALLISADWFLFVSRHGGGMIELSLWLTIALSCYTKLLERKHIWLIIFAASLAGLLFTPLGIYAAMTLLAILLAVRVFRERTLEASTLIKAVCVFILLVAVVVIGIIGFQNHAFAKALLGLGSLPTIPGFFKNMFLNTASIVAVVPASNPEFSPAGVLFVRFFELIFIIFGIMMLWKTRVNRLNLAVIILSTVLVITGGLLPQQHGGHLLLIPAVIFITAGIRHLMHRWRQTFPKNPYARIAAYIPLGVLFLSVTLLHYQSYFILWPVQTATHQAFSRDLELLTKELNTKAAEENTSCVVITDNSALKSLIAAAQVQCQPIFTFTESTSVDRFIVQPSALKSVQLPPSNETRSLVNESKADNVRWLVIKPAAQQ